MKKKIVLLLLAGCLLTGCGDKYTPDELVTEEMLDNGDMVVSMRQEPEVAEEFTTVAEESEEVVDTDIEEEGTFEGWSSDSVNDTVREAILEFKKTNTWKEAILDCLDSSKPAPKYESGIYLTEVRETEPELVPLPEYNADEVTLDDIKMAVMYIELFEAFGETRDESALVKWSSNNEKATVFGFADYGVMTDMGVSGGNDIGSMLFGALSDTESDDELKGDTKLVDIPEEPDIDFPWGCKPDTWMKYNDKYYAVYLADYCGASSWNGTIKFYVGDPSGDQYGVFANWDTLLGEVESLSNAKSIHASDLVSCISKYPCAIATEEYLNEATDDAKRFLADWAEIADYSKYITVFSDEENEVDEEESIDDSDTLNALFMKYFGLKDE